LTIKERISMTTNAPREKPPDLFPPPPPPPPPPPERYIKDNEIDALKKQSGMTNRDIANHLNIHPSSVGQRINGFTNWRYDEREKTIQFLQQIIEDE
jgi:hypothetical protein